MPSGADIQRILEDFVDDLNSCVNTHRLEDLLRGEDTLKGTEVKSKPESWTRKHLIRRLLEVVGFEWEDEIYGTGEGYPDFGLTNLDVPVIGEDKSINKIDEAIEDIKEYLNNRAASRDAEYGIATDGIEWIVYRIELGGDYLDYPTVEKINLRDALLEIARKKKYISQTALIDTDIDEICAVFYNRFSRDNFNKLLVQDAPKQIRERKKRGIEEFYDLYLELLFGEGKRDYQYDTTLLNDVQAPYSVTESDKRRFVIRLVNRLLFIKLLENRDVLPGNFLLQRVESYQKACDEIENLGGGLYKSQLEPLFFNLFNTPHEKRVSRHRGGWFDEVPFLNGSLFAPENLEREYDVDDLMLIQVVKDLVEGHKLREDANSGAFDPSLLGNVFEMTINYMSGVSDAQKKEGAYYTPNNVIRLITSQTVLPKIYDVLVEVFSSRLVSSSKDLNEDAARNIVEGYDLGEILSYIEQRQGYFGDPATIEEAYDRLGTLKVVDPACGSGHFLTAVLDEIHRVRLSLLRGLKGSKLDSESIYKSKKELVLNSIFGVDINPIAIEIAKLRVWLKMIEEGYRAEFGQLPNIDINIVVGNSLIGIPAISEGQSTLEKLDVDLDEVLEIRQRYKEGGYQRRELSKKIGEIMPTLTETYLQSLYHYFTESIDNIDDFEELVQSLDSEFSTIREVKVKKKQHGIFSAKDKKLLESIGFTIYTKSAKIEGKHIEKKVDELKKLLKGGFVLELTRKPARIDIDNLELIGDLSYGPFHWMIEFPEAVIENSEYTVEFDIVVGNPPYGNLLHDIEKRFTEGYETGGLDDIAAQFVERELQLLAENGYFGNVLTLRFLYQKDASVLRDLLRNNLDNARVACFTTRPSKIFGTSDPRVAIITGIKKPKLDRTESEIKTSIFIRFNEEDREQRISNISYESTEGLYLGKKIGSGEDYALPKVGASIVRSILQKLKSNSSLVLGRMFSRKQQPSRKHTIWRKRGPQYWINPFLENLYGKGNEPSDFDPMHFESKLMADAAFLLMQSSLFYLCWMVYGDQRHLNWTLIEAFPFPDLSSLDSNKDRIHDLADRIWKGMKERFDSSAGRTGEIQNMTDLKSLIDDVDDLFAPMFGLAKEEIEYIKNYDADYGRGA